MRDEDAVQKGWEYSANVMGADIGAYVGSDYISAVEQAIKELEDSINNHPYRGQNTSTLQGYMFEEMSANTFNINAVAADSKERATVPLSHEKFSADIEVGVKGKKPTQQYSAKSYSTADNSAKEQAKLNKETGKSGYYCQKRLVPKDQLEKAKLSAHHRAEKNQLNRPDVAEANFETEKELTDVIKGKRGVESRSVTRKENEEIARESKKKNFKADKHGISLESEITPEYVMRQAMKAGYTAATVTVAIQLTPEIFKAIDYLIKNGELNIQQIKKYGEKGISIGAESFIRGAVSSALLITCEKGVLGEAFIGIDPSLLGTTVAVVMQTIKDGFRVTVGEMEPQEMGSDFVNTTVTSLACIYGARLGKMIVGNIGIGVPVLGYLLGSLISSTICIVYNIGKNKFISFCTNTGFTCFGLVDQNYELPEHVLKELGIDTIPVPRTEVERSEVPRTQVASTEINTIEYETINFTILKRGLIGVNKIGYVLG